MKEKGCLATLSSLGALAGFFFVAYLIPIGAPGGSPGFTIKNNTTSTVAVIVDPPTSVIGGGTVDMVSLQELGTKYLNSGETSNFDVQAGSYTIGAWFVFNNSTADLNASSMDLESHTVDSQTISLLAREAESESERRVELVLAAD